MQHHGQTSIVTLTGLPVRTIARDISIIRAGWKELAEEPRRLAEQELASLGGLERYASTRLRQSRSSDWLRVILEIKGRRARLLGLDAPAKVTVDVEHTLRALAAEVGVDWQVVAKHLLIEIARLEQELHHQKQLPATQPETIEGEVLGSEEEQ